MMRYEYDAALVEESVFLAARRDAGGSEAALRRSLEPAYAIADTHERDAAFRRVYADWFVRLKLDRAVAELAAEYPLLAERVNRCIVRRSSGERRQSAELFVHRDAHGQVDGRTLTIEVCSDTLITPGRLASFLRRELLKVSDMLCEAFGYSPDLPDASPCEQNLIRDRYRVLWDLIVERRLSSAGHSSHLCEERMRRAFERAFTFRGAAPPAACFRQLWEVARATHAQLLAWAVAPQTLPGWNATDDVAVRRSGLKCPLCGFPTYDWYPFDTDRETAVEQTIAALHRGWTVNNGACRQCVEIYQASGRTPASQSGEDHGGDHGRSGRGEHDRKVQTWFA